MRGSLLTLVFALLSAVFLLLLIVFRTPFPLEPLMSWQDALDILTPLALLPVYALMLRRSTRGSASPARDLAFVLLGAVWVMGHGMHLSANSIDNLMGALEREGRMCGTAQDAVALTYFYDEALSHYLWHSGLVGLAILLVLSEWRRGAGEATVWWQVISAGILYGFTCFCVFLEGQTVLLGLPFAVGLLALGLAAGRHRMSSRPLLAFFTVAGGVAVLLFLGWGLAWGGFPEFSDVGLI